MTAIQLSATRVMGAVTRTPARHTRCCCILTPPGQSAILQLALTRPLRQG